MRNFNKYLSRKKRLIFWILFLFLYTATLAYAVPPTTYYQAGETLDPGCVPGSTKCTVLLIPDQTGNSGKYLTTDGTETSWGTVSAGGVWGSITGTLSNQTDLQNALNAKQATLVSGTNIKTINSTSLLGSGDIVISSYTDEQAQDAIGAMIDGTLVYVDSTPLLTRAALTGDVTASQGSNAVTVTRINGVSLAGLATGILKNTTGTGAPSIAVAGDFPTLNQNTTGTSANVTGIVALANGGTGVALSDPNANKLFAWDDTDNTTGFWTLGSGLSYDHSSHTLSSTGGSQDLQSVLTTGNTSTNSISLTGGTFLTDTAVVANNGNQQSGLNADGRIALDNDIANGFGAEVDPSHLTGSRTLYLPDSNGIFALGITDGSSTVTTGTNGVVDISSLLTGVGSSQWDNVTGGINYASGNVGIGNISPTALLDIKIGSQYVYQQSFSGGGLDDATYSGTYTGGAYSGTISVQIDSTGTPDTFNVSGLCSFTSGIAITGSDQLLCDGISINFASTTGHSINDTWTYVINTNSTNNNPAFSINDGVNSYFSVNALVPYSIFLGTSSGNAATNANFSNFIGYVAGNSATNASYSNFFGSNAGSTATNASNSNFFGQSAGYGATNASNSNFFGQSAGQSATGASYSNFLGFISGSGATNASNANFLGYASGYNASGAYNSNFIGSSAGYQATNSYNSNFFGQSAGQSATDANNSNFIGSGSGFTASSASNSNFIGINAGSNATNAYYSNFIGASAGQNAVTANNSIFIGLNSGLNDIVNNSSSNTSILIGDNTSTGGFSNSIALGAFATNTMSNQFLVASTYNNWQIAGVNYVWPGSQAAGSGYVLSNDGSGNLSWVPGGGGGGSPGGADSAIQFNDSGSFGGDENQFAWDASSNRLYVGAAVSDSIWDSIGLRGQLNILAPSSGSGSYAETQQYFPDSSPGLNDATFSGTYSGPDPTNYTAFEVQIDSTGSPDTFIWEEDVCDIVSGCVTTNSGSGVAIDGTAQVLADGISVTFSSTTGHNINDDWEYERKFNPSGNPALAIKSIDTNSNIFYLESNGDFNLGGNSGGVSASQITGEADLYANKFIELSTTNNTGVDIQNDAATFNINAANGVTISNLAGFGTQCVQVNNSGLLSTTACGGGGSSRFGVSGEDDTAAEDRAFDLSTNQLTINSDNGAGYSTALTIYGENFAAGSGNSDYSAGVQVAQNSNNNPYAELYSSNFTNDMDAGVFTDADNLGRYIDDLSGKGGSALYSLDEDTSGVSYVAADTSGTLDLFSYTNQYNFNGVTYSLPSTLGNDGDVLTTDSSGNLTWASGGGLSCTLGSEEITNGTFDTDASGWDLTGATYDSGDQALQGDGGSDQLRQNGTLVEGGTYTVSFDVTGASGADFTVYLGGAGDSQSWSSPADGTLTFTGTWSDGGLGVIAIINANNFSGTIDNISVKEQTCASGSSLIGSTSTAGTETFLGTSLADLGTASTDNTVFIGINSGINATSASSSIFVGTEAGADATNAFGSVFLGSGYGEFSMLGAGTSATNALFSNFIGSSAGANATDASSSNFIGGGAGYGAATASNSIFIGSGAGYLDEVDNTTGGEGSTDYSILIGNNTSTSGFSNSIALGSYATNTASNQLVIGSDIDPISSVFIGGGQGTAATDSTLFIGLNAGQDATSASNSIFLGSSAGINATSAASSIFLGAGAGSDAANALGSVFLGSSANFGPFSALGAGTSATNALFSNFIGSGAGANAASAGGSNFIGFNAGLDAYSAGGSNFFGAGAGNGASNAAFSIFLGSDFFDPSNGTGSGAINAANSIFIGTSAGLDDPVDNTNDDDDYSILIGNNTSTDGFSNSIALGNYATNTATNQFMIGSSTRPIDEIDMISTGGASCAIDINGTVCSSDINLKKNITIFDSQEDDTAFVLRTDIDVTDKSALEDLMNLTPIEYNWNTESDTDPKHIGFIAQEIKQIFPTIVSTASNGYLQINYAAMTPILTKAIQELDLKINDIDNLTPGTDDAPNFVDRVMAWFADAGNSIKDFIADRIKARQELCINNTCINEAQLIQILQNNHTSSSAPTPPVDTTPPADTTPPNDTTTPPTDVTPPSDTTLPADTTAPSDTSTPPSDDSTSPSDTTPADTTPVDVTTPPATTPPADTSTPQTP